ncbi:MAG: mono/diheme cytochrome c family protein [Rhodothermales bacterium]|jgi:mono/diheme cytochrome c family protein
MHRFLTLMLVAASIHAARPTKDELAKGKALYEGAGSCVACHQANGKGIPGSIPSLEKSSWVSTDANRLIAIALRGVDGPMKIEGHNYNSTMPPQLLFDDAQLALMLSYVRNNFGNKGDAIAAADVKALRDSLPPDVFTVDSLLKRYPFKDSKVRKKNGSFKPTFDDAIGANITSPVVYRTFMPGASPAAFAVALPGGQFYCWDAGESRLRFVWTKGGFIRNNKRHWSSNGKPVCDYYGQPYYTARSSFLNAENANKLAPTNHGKPIYDTAEAKDFPIAIGNTTQPRPRYRGYRLIDGYPEFWVSLGGADIYERIVPDRSGIARHFRIDGHGAAVTVALKPSADCELRSSAGKLAADGMLSLSAEEAKAFTVTIIEKNPTLAAGVQQ